MKCQTYFLEIKIRKKIQCPLLNFLPRVLIVNNVLTCSVLPACKTIIIRSILVLVHSLKEAEINFDSFTTMIYSAKIKKCQSDVIEEYSTMNILIHKVIFKKKNK